MTRDNTHKKIKVLYVITKSNWGGAQRYVYDLASMLPPAQYEKVVALGGSGEKNTPVGLLGKRFQDTRKARLIFVKNFLRDISFLDEMKAFFELIDIFKKERPDVVHLNSSKAGGIGALAARVAGIKKIVFTVHGWAFNEDRSLIIRIILWKLSWLTALFATDIIVLGEREKRQAKQMPFVRSKVHLIHHGLEEAGQFEKEKARTELRGNNIFPNPFWIGTIAELHHNKGLEYVIRAVRYIAPVTLCIIGDGEEKANLLRLIEKLNLQDRVILAGFKVNAASFLSAFDVFVLPSLKEGLPYTILEAGIRGLPVIAINVGGIREIIPDKDYGILLTPKNSDGLASAIESLMKNDEYRKRLGENLQKRIKEEFSISSMLNKTISVYLS